MVLISEFFDRDITQITKMSLHETCSRIIEIKMLWKIIFIATQLDFSEIIEVNDHQ